jgi:CHAT domain-containing protein
MICRNNPTKDLTGEAFEYAQLAQSSVDAQVVTQMALTYSANGTEAKVLIDKLRDAVAYRNQLNKKIITALSNKNVGTEALFQTSIDMQASIDKNEVNIKQLDSQLKNSFPTYSQIINPAPVPLADIQKTLAKDEALLIYLLADEEDNYVFVVKHDKAVLQHLPIGKYNGLQERIYKLRCAFYSSCEEGKPLQQPTAGQMPEPFDIELANGLYRDLIAPIETELSNTKQLLIVADGALHSLPFQILVKTIDPDAPKIGKFNPSQYKQVDWLVNHFAFSSLPSVKSLTVLRDKNKTAAIAQQPFIGFGDPEFQDKVGDTKGLTVEALFRAGDEKKRRLIDLPRLPETARELKNLAKALDYVQYLPDPVLRITERLGLTKQAVYLQKQATESEVKKLSDSEQLSSRVLAFSTHGLLNHEAKNIAGIPAEAGLVLPEKNASGKDANDGLLTGSEISQLNINADWVLLSACNTATLEKNNEASGLSELAKAFFLKGSRSILASHWNVASDTT